MIEVQYTMTLETVIIRASLTSLTSALKENAHSSIVSFAQAQNYKLRIPSVYFAGILNQQISSFQDCIGLRFRLLSDSIELKFPWVRQPCFR